MLEPILTQEFIIYLFIRLSDAYLGLIETFHGVHEISCEVFALAYILQSIQVYRIFRFYDAQEIQKQFEQKIRAPKKEKN